MEVESSICLSDLVPALRWSRPQQVAEILADPRLPAAWWSSVALSRALGTTGLDWVCERLARLARARWDHLSLADVLPALTVHHIDPTLPGWPEPTKSAITGLGGWHRLRRLGPGDLANPAAPPEAVIGSLFREILAQIPVQRDTSPHPVQRQHTAPQPAIQVPSTPAPGVPAPGAPAADTTMPVATAPGAPVPGMGATATPMPVAGAASPAPVAPGANAPGHMGPGAAGPAGPGVPGAAGQAGPGAPGTAGQAGPGAPGTAGQPGSEVPGQPGAGIPGAGGARPAGPPLSAPPAVPAAQAAQQPAPTDTDHAMVRVVDGLFRSLDRLELAVAVHRLFAEDPVSLRTLAHKMLVDRDMLSQAQRTAEERVLHWLRSSESAPVTGHMFRLTEWLGAAATEEQLVGADPAHPVMVPTLRTPLWRVLVTLMPDRRLQDGWLVVGDLHGLQSRTKQLLASARPDADRIELLEQLGIRRHSAQAWLDSLPSDAPHRPSPAEPPPPAQQQPLPRRTPGANGHHHRGGTPIPAAPAGSIDPTAALATLSALSGGRSPVLAGTPATPPPPPPSPTSDPRRWQRIEVTPEHLRGGPVPVPEGYAAQLGMRPGTLLSVTGPGDNAIVLVWQGHQPVFDSLQPVLMRLNARPGDQVYVTVDGYRLEAQLTG